VVAALAIAAALGCSWLAFSRARLLLDPVFPALAVLAIYLLMSLLAYIRTELQRYQLRRAFAQYLAPQLLRELEEHPQQLRLGGEAREMTFLFTDIAGFTNLTEATPPARLVPLLNRYLDGVCTIVIEHGGYIDKIIGDAVFAIFNAPAPQPEHARLAVECALAIDRFARDFSADMQQQSIPFGKTRIGVNTGTATVGNFGGQRRFDYTAHGDAVNTAARLEAANKQLGTNICVAGTTVAQCHSVSFRPVGTLLLRGKSTGVETFEPVADDDDAAGILRLAHYRHAYDLLQRGDPAAIGAFQELELDYPDDPVVALHRQRLSTSTCGTLIRVG
jgi:adenylate cyclase